MFNLYCFMTTAGCNHHCFGLLFCPHGDFTVPSWGGARLKPGNREALRPYSLREPSPGACH